MADPIMTGGLTPIEAFALVGVAGIGAQWLAWRMRLPGIVLMLAMGLVLGPLTGVFVPSRDIGPLTGPLISLAVAVILFEGGMTLSFRQLADARPAVRRLVYVGAPLGWVLSSLGLALVVGLSWQTSIVFGGIMIVTGPTVIAPLLRQAKLASRPAQILQWEAIVNDPVGALVAVIALEVVLVQLTELGWSAALGGVALGIGAAVALGLAGGAGIAVVMKRNLVPEYMKGPLLFVAVLAIFSAADALLHESGLLAVTVMGLVIANAGLASYDELLRFKEQSTVLLVSGVFILLAANVNFADLQQLSWRAFLFVAVVILVVRPATVLVSMIGAPLPWKERLLIALTGPRGVVLMAVSGIFGERLVAEGVADGALVTPLAFVLVVGTVVLHGFTLSPLARAFGLSAGEGPGLLIVGGSTFATALARALKAADVRVMIADPNRARLRDARAEGIETWYGDILGEAAEHSVEFLAYPSVLAASDNDAYNTLVATDLAPDFGRGNIWQIPRHREEAARHALPSQLGGRRIGDGRTLADYLDLLAQGWVFRTTRLTDEYGLDAWSAERPGALPVAVIDDSVEMVTGEDSLPDRAGVRIVALVPPELARRPAAAPEAAAAEEPAPPDPVRPAKAAAEADAVRRRNEEEA